MARPHYDIILAGGGVAGLSLACHLARSPLRDRSILVVDKDMSERDDRTLCYWSARPTLFDRAATHSWSRLRVMTECREIVADLGAYRYRMIRGVDFRGYAREMLASPRVDFLQARVEHVQDGAAAATVQAGASTYTASWVFDSRQAQTPPAASEAGADSSCRLYQQFSGWEITSARPAFTPDVATLLDFRVPQDGAMRFFYILPFTRQRALVEHVACLPALQSWAEHDRALETYLTSTLGAAACSVERRESGISVLTDRPFPRRLGSRIMAIGALGGQIKPTTGYAFARIQQDSAGIVRSLLRTGQPFDVPSPRRRFRLYDAAMLATMARHGGTIKPIFAEMFRQNPAERILRFLDEQTQPWDEARLAATLPPTLVWRTLVPERARRSGRCARSPLHS
jgi:lycopene beta-cyclase